MNAPALPVYKGKDFSSDQEVRWCPGCGDYGILKAVQNAMPKIGKRKEDIVFISGIGCSSRFPYYMETYGMHSIHGRAPAVATGTKLANPDLSVWVITGDGDGLAIGGNHFIHAIRRNVDLNILLFNNEIYGLTKGQFSPTSALNLRTKSTPKGNIDNPFNPGQLILGAQGNFFARVSDKDPKSMTQVFVEAEAHTGASVVEILQNCPIFNDGVHDEVTGREGAAENQLHLVHGEKMLFGKEKKKGIVLNGFKLEVATIGENGVSEDDILVHDAKDPDPSLHTLLVRMGLPTHPVAMGVIRAVEAEPFDERIEGQIGDYLKDPSSAPDLDSLFHSGDTWEIT